MTEFPNFGLINQMSKHIANNASPRVLDYQSNGNMGYVYTPTSTDLITHSIPINNSISQQQRFNAIADQLIYNNNTFRENEKDINNNNSIYPLSNNSNVEQRIIKQGSVIDSLINPQQANYNTTNINSSQNATLNATASQGRINDTTGKKESFTTEGMFDMKTKDSQNKLNVISIVIICFILFMLIQLYLSQKKLEFMMSIYKPQYGSQCGLASFPKSEVF